MEKGPVFGLSIGDLLTIYDRDSRSWKMSECLFTGDYAKYSEAFPKSGIMLNGRIYEQATWAPRTEGRESGLWPTPQVFDATCGDLKGKEYNGETRHAMKLIQAAKRFPTPHSNCHTGPGKRGKGGENLQTAVKWPTPRSRDWKGKSQRGADPENRDCLPNAVHWRTPAAHDPGINPKRLKPIKGGELGGMNRHFDLHTGRMAQIGLTQQAALRDGAGNGGQLNPTWVDWLMGYPIGWTDCADSEMRLSLK